MSSFTNGSGSLRPTWSRNSGSQGGGRGFQPPPAVPPERPPEGRRRSSSQGSSGSGASGEHRPSNKFAALDDDEDLPAESKLAQSQQPFRRGSAAQNKNSRGRSLADLAANVPDSSTGRPNFRSSSRSDSFSETTVKVTRYTREKLLALRPRPDNDSEAPEDMKHLEGNPILSDVPLDPVCWDTFDAEEIWAQALRERTTRSSSMLALKTEGGLKPEVPVSRRSSSGPGFGKWQRGVALPPPDENSHRRGSSGRIDAENPNDLWDDPLASTDAAADFSAFGEIPDDPKNTDGGDAFDFDKMAKQSQQFDDELRGNSRSSGDLQEELNGELSQAAAVSVTVDPHRPLASIGTTIRSGSGDDVNVFEDFDENPPTPAAEATSASSAASEQTSVKSADEDPTASSRLMKMIGVNREETSLSNPGMLDKEKEEEQSSSMNPWASNGKTENPEAHASGISGISVDIPSNPWGESILPTPAKNSQGGGFDLASRLEQASSEQTAREEMQRRQSEQEAERVRRMQEEERRVIEERQRQQEMQQQQHSAPSQVELVLMERISVILENSWGRSDLMSVLNTLHSEDSRVIQLLGNIDALRALIARHPRRVAIRQDPAFGAEMAVLLLTNSQFQAQQQQQEQQQQQAQARAQEEELKRREQLIQTQNNQQRQNGTSMRIIPDQPWFYSDPQKNIQGPFRGEEMRQWLEAGYFKGDLPISQQTNGPFIPLSAIFPDLSLAFRVPGDDNEKMMAKEEEKRAREEERRLLEEKERQEAMEAAQRKMELERQREIAQREMERERERELELERERKLAQQRESEAKGTAEAQKAIDTQNEQNESSNQLKMMLGLGGVQQFNKDNDEPTLVEESKATPQMTTSQPPIAPAPAPAKPAWGSVVAGQAKRTKSMAEIQQEEARQAAFMEAERRSSGRSSSGGWANVAASRGGSSGWQGGAVKHTAPAVVTGSNTMTSAQMINTRPAPAKTIHRQSSAPSAMQPARRSSQSQPKPADDFGASMSSALESWCKDQMRKLNGSDDLTLASFCMTLNDPAEIRQYLTAYLGSTPQVNSFATEFIHKRGLGKNQQEEWESTKPKKGKKKGGK